MMIFEELAYLFAEYGYAWKLEDGTEVVPSAEDIQKVVDAAAAVLYDSPENSTIETGRLIVQKVSNTNYAIYLHIGDTK